MGTAIPEERRLVIMERVRSRPLVKPAELADELGVSSETIRRDLVALEEDGLVRRVYGGATRVAARAFEPAFEMRRMLHRERKIAIARLVASLIEPGDTLILDVGTTVAALAGELPLAHRGIVLTNSLLVANALADRDGIEVITSGGRVRSGDLACFGPVSEAFFRDYFADKAFMGAGGVHAEMGLTDYYPDEIASRRVILEHAAERYVLADASKLGLVALGKVCDLAGLSAVITDDHADERELERFEQSGVTVMVAHVPEGERPGAQAGINTSEGEPLNER
jgi:DeoR family fructose operon transcriptional repressor